MTKPHDTQADAAVIAEKTRAWVAGWRTGPEAPFEIGRIADLYVKDDRLFSYDFGRPHTGVSGWETAARYYAGFMAIPKSWRLTAGDDLRVTVKGEVAWATLSLSGAGEMSNGDPIDLPEARVTLIFEREAGEDWLIVHEHGSASIPFPDAEATRLLLEAGDG